MHHNLAHEVASLGHLSAAELRHKFSELFREPTRSSNRVWLVKRIAWRMQALAEGDLSERARQRAAELANDADLRLSPPRLEIGTGRRRGRRLRLLHNRGGRRWRRLNGRTGDGPGRLVNPWSRRR